MSRCYAGERNGQAKLKASQVREIREALSLGETVRKIAQRFAVSKSLVSLIGRGERWPHA